LQSAQTYLSRLSPSGILKDTWDPQLEQNFKIFLKYYLWKGSIIDLLLQLYAVDYKIKDKR